MSKQEETKDLVEVGLTDYAITQPGVDIGELVKSNLEGEGISFMDLERVKIPSGGGKTWTITDENGEEVDVREIEGIILHSKMIRSYWKDEYSGGGTPPDCSSDDCVTGVGDPGGKCNTCEFNKFGTKKHSKACAERRLFFLLTSDSVLPVVISIPPTSLDAAKKYLINLTSKSMVKSYAVTTKFTLDKDKSKDGIEFSRVIMTKGERLDDMAVRQVESYRDGIIPLLTQAASDIASGGSEGTDHQAM